MLMLAEEASVLVFGWVETLLNKQTLAFASKLSMFHQMHEHFPWVAAT